MADSDIATRAPESDAQEDVPVTTTTTADPTTAAEEPAKPKVSEHCVTDRPTRSCFISLPVPTTATICVAPKLTPAQQAARARQARSGSSTTST